MDGSTLHSQVLQQSGKFDDMVIAAGGRDSTALRAALLLSDILLVPFHPRSYDVWALDDMAALVDEARAWHDGLQAKAVLNCADPGDRSKDNSEAAAAVGELAQFEYLPTPLRRRKAFANAAGAGLSVLEIHLPAARAAGHPRWDLAEARAAINKIINLQKEHELDLADDFHFRYAQVAAAADLPEPTLEAVVKYLRRRAAKGNTNAEALELRN